MKTFHFTNTEKTNIINASFFRTFANRMISMGRFFRGFSLLTALSMLSVEFAIAQSALQSSNLSTLPTDQALAIAQAQENTPLGFKENKGQMQNVDFSAADFVLFKVEQPGLNVWVTTSGLTYQFFTIEKKLITNPDGTPKLGIGGKQEKVKTIRWHRVDMVLKNATIRKENINKENVVSQGDERYYLAHCPDGIVGVQSFGKVTISNVYDGIDWVLYTDNQTGYLKFDFVVHPGADPNQLQLIYEGSGTIDILPNQLLLTTPLGSLTEGELLCYQGNASNTIEASYQSEKLDQLTYLGAGNNQINTEELTFNTENLAGFSYQITINLADYNSDETLIIDPQLVWGTMYGGNTDDGFMAMETDNNGNVFVTGYAIGANFPVQNAGTYFQGTNVGNDDAFILKFDNAGNRLWATYYGGTSFDYAYSVCIDGLNNVWIAGATWSSDLPLQDAGTYYQGANGGVTDAFVLKFNNAGTRQLATLYGGNSDDVGYSIATDGLNNVWITGYTKSTNFPVQNAGTFYQGTNGGWWDLFILKFDNTGNRLWATYCGGIGYEQGFSIEADGLNNVFITGRTNSSNFPVQDAGTYYQGANVGGDDAFVLKFNNAGTRLWGTYYGGTVFDGGFSIAIDGLNNVWITGFTSSTDFPVQNAGTFFQGTNAGSDDAFLLKFDNTGTRLWATYYGGTGSDRMTDEYDHIVIDSCNNVYVIFETASSNIPTYSYAACHYLESVYNGARDEFLLQFDNNGSRLWATYLGGNNADFRGALAMDNDNNLLVVGEFADYASSATLTLLDLGSGAYFDDTPNGNDDSYILKFKQTSTSQSQTNATVCSPCDGQAIATVTCGLPTYSFTWSTGDTKLNTSDMSDTLSNLCAGNYWVEIQSDCSVDTLFYNITGSPCNINASFIPSSLAICQGDSITFTDNSTGLIISWNWTFQGGTPNTANTQGPQTVTFNSLGTYNITLQVGDGVTTDDTTISITVNSSSLFTQNIAICQGGSIIVGTNTYTTAGIFLDTLVNSLGCDSIITTNLTINPIATGTDVKSACDSLTWIDGITYYTSTNTPTFTIIGGAQNGCDSIVTLNLSINLSSTAINTYNECEGFSVTVGGNTYTTTGIFLDTLVNSLGCDSLITTNLTINPIATGTDVKTACDSLTWIDGITYYTSTNTPTHTIIGGAQNGCDSIVTLNLTINFSSTTINIYNECEGFSVTVGMNTYTSTGIYTDVISGCDTIVTNLTIQPAPTLMIIKTDDNCGEFIGEITAIANSNYPPITYLWSNGSNDSTINNLPAGTYTITINDASGCTNEDVIEILDAEIDCNYFVNLPNVFTPNGDGNNDVFFVRGRGIATMSLKIYNRWGVKVFETNNLSEGWDGTYQGEEQNTAVFMYVLEGVFFNGNAFKESGDIGLVR